MNDKQLISSLAKALVKEPTYNQISAKQVIELFSTDISPTPRCPICDTKYVLECKENKVQYIKKCKCAQSSIDAVKNLQKEVELCKIEIGYLKKNIEELHTTIKRLKNNNTQSLAVSVGKALDKLPDDFTIQDDFTYLDEPPISPNGDHENDGFNSTFYTEWKKH